MIKAAVACSTRTRTVANTHFKMGDTQNFCEQQADMLQWDQSNKDYILTHGVSVVDWRVHKSPRAEPVYDVYMQYWKHVNFDDLVSTRTRLQQTRKKMVN
jgi:hypothetical protein